MTPEERLAELNEEKASIEVQIQETQGNPDLSPERIASDVNMLTSKLKELAKARNRTALEVALGGRRKLFDVLRNVKAGQPLTGLTLDDLPKLSRLQKEIEAGPQKGITKDIEVANEAIKDFESQITAIHAKIAEERRCLNEIAAQAFEEAPLFVAMNFPRIAAEICGEAISQAPVPVRTGSSMSAGDNPDQKAMLNHINADVVREAISAGTDAESNADILRWIAKNKLGKEVLINQSLRTKVYHIREGLGLVTPRK